MKYQTLSLLAGNDICNASCPFCVSRMTATNDIENATAAPINFRNLRKTLNLAKNSGINTIIITGKGEPTLYPEHITEYLAFIEKEFTGCFPFIELQTNGWLFEKETFKGKSVNDLMVEWYDLGLTTVMISNVGIDDYMNHQTYFPKKRNFVDYDAMIAFIHKFGLNVRYTTVGVKNGVCNQLEMDKLVIFCKSHKIEQLTWRAVAKTSSGTTRDSSVNGWVSENGLTPEQEANAVNKIKTVGTLLYNLVHGTQVYDYLGQNVCITTCLTLDPDEEMIRQLIFYPDGKVFTDWQYTGSRLL